MMHRDILAEIAPEVNYLEASRNIVTKDADDKLRELCVQRIYEYPRPDRISRRCRILLL